MLHQVSLLSPFLEWRDTLRLLCASRAQYSDSSACWHALASKEQSLLRHVRGDAKQTRLPLCGTEVVWLAATTDANTLYVGTLGATVLCVRQGYITSRWHLSTMRGWPTQDGGVVVHVSASRGLLAISGPGALPVPLAWRADVVCVAASGRMLIGTSRFTSTFTGAAVDAHTQTYPRGRISGFGTTLAVGMATTLGPSAVACVHEVFVYVCEYGNVNALWPCGQWVTLPLPGGPAVAVVGAWCNRFLAVASTGARYVCDIASDMRLRLVYRCTWGPPPRPRARAWMAGRYAVCAGRATDLRSGYNVRGAPAELAGKWSAATEALVHDHS